MFEKIKEAAGYIQNLINFNPKIGVILGTGLGALADGVENPTIISYRDIPHFPISTVESHKGQFVFGEISGKKVVVMQGRFHFYEGYALSEVTFPIRVIRALGVEILFISNAAGGLNNNFKVGDLMLIEDHINLTGNNPLIGKNDDRLGERFPDMTQPYCLDLLKKAELIAQKINITCQKGVYVGMTGPSIETRAEWRFLRIIGGDAVGMSTVPEVIVARHSGMRVLAVSVITNKCESEVIEEHVSLDGVIGAANEAGSRLGLLFKMLLLEDL